MLPCVCSRMQFLAALLDCAPALEYLEVASVELTTNKCKKRTWALRWLKINHGDVDLRHLVNLPRQAEHRLLINVRSCDELKLPAGFTVSEARPAHFLWARVQLRKLHMHAV